MVTVIAVIEAGGRAPDAQHGRAAGAIIQLCLYKKNGNVLGAGTPSLMGPSFVDSINVDKILPFTTRTPARSSSGVGRPWPAAPNRNTSNESEPTS